MEHVVSSLEHAIHIVEYAVCKVELSVLSMKHAGSMECGASRT